MRVADLLASRPDKPLISFEFFRPKDDKAAVKLDKALAKLAAAEPDYVTVTFGAGGSTREGSFQLVDKLKNELRFVVVACLAGVGLGPEDLAQILDRFRELGTKTILAIRGDTPEEDSFAPHPDALPHASDLIGFIKDGYDFCVGAAGYPEGHTEALSRETDIEYLKLKQDRGADYIVAQYFYDNHYFFDFIDRCRTAGITIPIIPGLMPIYSVKMMETLAHLCGVTITDTLRGRLMSLPPGDKKAVTQLGVEFATEQCRGLLTQGVPGLHFYTMNRANSIVQIVSALRDEGRL